MKNLIPRWTDSDMVKARENAASIEGSGSTTPILDRHKIQYGYKPNGVVYVSADLLNEVFAPILGEFHHHFLPFNDAPGPHPWQAEITLKKCFKKLFDNQSASRSITSCQTNKQSPCPAQSVETIQTTLWQQEESTCSSATST